MAIGTGAAILGAAGIGAASSLLGGKKSGSVTQSNDPWAGVQPYLTSLYQRGNRLYKSGLTPSPYTLQGRQMAAQTALNPNSLTSGSQRLLSDTIAGNYLRPESNPYLADSVRDALGLTGSAFASQFSGAGANMGNTGYQEGLTRTLAQTALPIYAQNYSNERQNQLNAAQLAPALDYAQSDRLSALGAEEEASPWANLARFQSTLGPGSQFGSQTNPYFTNPFSGALGGAAGGLALYRMMPPNFFGGGGGNSIFAPGNDMGYGYN